MATVASQDCFVNNTQSYWAKADGAGTSQQSTFSTILVSTANIEAANIVDINNLFLSTQVIEAQEAFISSISTYGIYLDGALLTTVGSELLLNGIPIATTSNVSSIADWSYDPAVSTLNMNSQSSINATLTSTNVINAGYGNITNLVCNDISTTTLTVVSTIHSVSTISTLEVEAQVGLFSSINGSAFPGIPVDLTQWATLPAVSSIYSGGGLTNDLNIIATRFIKETASGISSVSDRGVDVGGNAFHSITAQNGQGGKIELTANSGFGGINGGNISLTANGGFGTAGLYGAVDITAEAGVASGVVTGGAVNIRANSGTAGSNLTSVINLNAGGINSYAGVFSPTASVFGYNFTYGTLGVSIVAGTPPSGFQVPGTVFIAGLAGTSIYGDLYTTNIYPYWNGTQPPNNLLVSGRTTIIGSASVCLRNVSSMAMEGGGAITGVNSINGSPYPPPVASIPADLVVSTLVAARNVSTPELFVSSVNGSPYNGSPGVPTQIAQAGASVVCNTVGGIEIYTSTNVDLNLYSGLGMYLTATPDGEIVLQKSATGGSSQLYMDGVGNVNLRAGTAPGINLTYSTGEITLNNKLNVDTTGEILTFPQIAGSNVGQIEGISTINGTAFPPTAVVGANLIVSTLVADISVSTQALFISSINGAEYNPGGGGVPSSIAYGASFMRIDPDGAMVTQAVAQTYSITSGNLMTLNSGQNGISLIDSDQGANMKILGSIDIGPTTTAFNIGSVPTNVSSIYISSVNGSAYPPPAGSIPPDLVVSSLVANKEISTPVIKCPDIIVDVSSIIQSGGDGVLNIYAGNYISMVSDGNYGPALLSIASLTNVSSINGSAYPPSAGSIPSDLVVSSLVAAKQISTQTLFISSINNAPYPPPSSTSPNGSFSTLNVSSYVLANDFIALSTLIVGDANVSSCTTLYNRGTGSADTYISMGRENVSGSDGILRIVGYTGGNATVSIGALTGISSINNNPYNPLPSTFTSLYTSSFFTSSLNGQPINNMNFSSLSISGYGSITLEDNPSNQSSAPIFFKTGSETIAQGILQVCKTTAYTDASTRPYSGLVISALSTLGAAQPIIAGSILLNPTPDVYVGAPITGNTAGNIIFPLSTLVGVSTINGTKIQAPVWVAGGVDTIITTNISTANVNIAINPGISSISATGTAKFFITGQACYTSPGGVNTIASWTIARSSTYPPTAVSSVNLASGGGFISANSISGNAYRLSGVLTPATYTSATPFSIVDTPPPGTYWYSLWAAGSTTTPITTENVTMTILQVAS